VRIGCPGPHHIRRSRVRPGPARVPGQHCRRAHHHHVRAGLDPRPVGLGGIGIDIAEVGPALEHVHHAGLVGRRRLVAHPGHGPGHGIGIHAHWIGAGRLRVVGHAGETIGALAQRGHGPIGIGPGNRRMGSHACRSGAHRAADGIDLHRPLAGTGGRAGGEGDGKRKQGECRGLHGVLLLSAPLTALALRGQNA